MSIDAETIETLWSAGFVNRWHSNDDPRLRNAQDTNHAHSCRVLILTQTLGILLSDAMSDEEMGSSTYYALLHDMPEKEVGDISGPAKERNPALREIYDAAHAAWWDDLGIDAPEATPLAKLCDHLDAILFVKTVASDLLERDEWVVDKLSVLREAHSLGLYNVVAKLIYGPGADTDAPYPE